VDDLLYQPPWSLSHERFDYVKEIAVEMFEIQKGGELLIA